MFKPEDYFYVPPKGDIPGPKGKYEVEHGYIEVTIDVIRIVPSDEYLATHEEINIKDFINYL